MIIPRIDQPIRPGKAFWIACTALMLPAALLAPKEVWHGPLLPVVAWVLLPSFLLTLLVYTAGLFTLSLLANFRGQVLALVLMGLEVGVVLLWEWLDRYGPAEPFTVARSLWYLGLNIAVVVVAGLGLRLLGRFAWGRRAPQNAAPPVSLGDVEPLRKLRR